MEKLVCIGLLWASGESKGETGAIKSIHRFLMHFEELHKPFLFGRLCGVEVSSESAKVLDKII